MLGSNGCRNLFLGVVVCICYSAVLYWTLANMGILGFALAILGFTALCFVLLIRRQEVLARFLLTLLFVVSFTLAMDRWSLPWWIWVAVAGTAGTLASLVFYRNRR